MQNLIWIALVLIVVWAIARLIAGVAGLFLNLLWIVAIILLFVWLWGVITGSGAGSGTV